MRKSKKYYKNLSQSYSEKINTLEKVRNDQDRAIKFLLAEPNPYRVDVITRTHLFSWTEKYVNFEYVDEKGVFHSITRPLETEKLTCLSTSKEAAIFSYSGTNYITYWMLQKASEVFAEIPENLVCMKDKKICELTDLQN